MANSYNSMPVIIDTDMSTSWKANQTLFASAAKAVFGRVSKIQIVSAGTTVAGTISVVDPTDSTVLFTAGVGAGAGGAGTILYTQDFTSYMPAWRDWKATLGSTVTKLYIWYRP